MWRAGFIVLVGLATADGYAAKPATLQLPAFPLPALVREGGPAKEISSMRLLRELYKSGVKPAENFETVDSDYALLRGDALGNLGAWLEATCQAVGFDLPQARARAYDGVVFARLLSVATSLAVLRQSDTPLAMPIGVLVCRRDAAWGELPGDGNGDAYVLFATDAGLLVYDPPTGQLTPLADFPNKDHISRIRF